MKKIVVKLLKPLVRLDKKEIESLIEIPPNPNLGDFAFPCFSLAKVLKKNPVEISKDLAKRLNKKLPVEIDKVLSTGPYLNLFTNKNLLASVVIKDSLKAGFGKNDDGNGRNFVIDMSSPNIAKPFGVGHLRSTIIGNSLAKIAEANGYESVKINYLGDWGTQFGKIIFGYKKFGNKKKLEENPLKYLQEIYVKSNAKDYEEGSREEFKKLEDGNTESLKLWKKFKDLSLKEFNSIYNTLGIKFDVTSGESLYNDKMGKVLKDLEKKKLLKKDGGALVVDLKKEGLGVALIQKSDGTSLYVTRDLAAAIERKKEYNFMYLIYEVGSEQKLHFKQIFKILEKLGYGWANGCFHVAHGLYLDKDGKKFATRKGKTVFMKDILDEVKEKAMKNLKAREKLPRKELEKRAKKITIAAIFYGDLKNNRENNMIFDIDKFLNFEGNTGPYLLYSYARASSLLKKVKNKQKLAIGKLNDSEIKLVKKIGDFPDVVKLSFKNLAPNLIANYSYELSQAFNEFYHKSPVLGSSEEGFRLKLVEAFKFTLEKSLDLLGIGVLEEM
ncbi:MAG: arginine--tRNA ligase [archaeon]